MAAAQSCGVCFYYLATPGPGVCRRYPPQMMGTASAAFPPIPAAQWCGEFSTTGVPPVSGSTTTVLTSEAANAQDAALQKQIADLNARVSVLEAGGVTPPNPNPTPSPDGTTVTTIGPAVIDAQLRSFTIVAADASAKGQQVAVGGVRDTRTANVAKLYAKVGVCYQQNTAGAWYHLGANNAWAGPDPDPTGTTPPNPSGVFQVGPGGIVAPDGTPFRVNGMNIMARQTWGNGQFDYQRANGAKLRSLWGPAFNFVRLADLYGYGIAQATHPASDANIRNWVADLNSHGIIVYAEVHYTGNYATGQALTDACSWLAEWANWAKSNPMVWLGTQNEPHGDGPGISHMMKAMYDAVRGQGFNGPVGHCLGNPGQEIDNMDPAAFTGQTNSFFDGHYYGWNLSSGVHYSDVARSVAKYHNAQGSMNCLCLETGDATDGNNRDGNWQQVLQEAYSNPPGCAPWYSNWSATSSGADLLLAAPFDYTALTDYGQFCKSLQH